MVNDAYGRSLQDIIKDEDQNDLMIFWNKKQQPILGFGQQASLPFGQPQAPVIFSGFGLPAAQKTTLIPPKDAIVLPTESDYPELKIYGPVERTEQFSSPIVPYDDPVKFPKFLTCERDYALLSKLVKGRKYGLRSGRSTAYHTYLKLFKCKNGFRFGFFYKENVSGFSLGAPRTPTFFTELAIISFTRNSIHLGKKIEVQDLPYCEKSRSPPLFGNGTYSTIVTENMMQDPASEIFVINNTDHSQKRDQWVKASLGNHFYLPHEIQEDSEDAKIYLSGKYMTELEAYEEFFIHYH